MARSRYSAEKRPNDLHLVQKETHFVFNCVYLSSYVRYRYFESSIVNFRNFWNNNNRKCHNDTQTYVLTDIQTKTL